MFIRIAMPAIIAATLTLTGCGTNESQKAEQIEFENEADKQVYAFGAKVGDHVSALLDKGDRSIITSSVLVAGFSDALNDNAQFTKEEIDELASVFTDSLTKQQQDRFNEANEKNLAEAERFLENNKLSSDITTLPSGLQYKIVKSASGDKPSPEDTVIMTLTVKLTDDTQIQHFTSEKPLKVDMSELILGIQEGLQLMSIGAKYTFFIHPDLAYGDLRTPNIPANSAIIATIELLDAK